MKKKVYIETYGCQMNVADSETVAGIMQSREYIATDNITDADVIIINTCSVRDNAEKKIWNRLDHIKSLKRKNKNLKTGIIGCMAQRVGEKFLEHPAVDFVAGPDSYRSLPDLVDENDIAPVRTEFDINETYSGIEQVKIDNNIISGFIAITRGCNNFCSYCIVPYTRGRERSLDYKDILTEVKNLREKGFKELTLLGQNVNSYYFEEGDKKVNFPNLLRMVAETAPEMRIRFTTSHPKDFSDELIETMAAYKNICNHIHLPVQSGSNKILEKMNRKYTREWYLNRIEAIRSAIPDCGISTDLFCGFSGESEEDFQQTLDLMEQVKFDLAFMFKYSVRPETYAAKHFDDDVPEEIKIDRLNRMIKLQNKISLENNKADIGKSFEVLVEGYSKRSKKMLFGRTEQNKVVIFPAQNYKAGDFVNVKIIDATSATLKSEIIN
ncbi:MAG: tRNA (N6-isopentenyl adenosine(37)-C2)-methylthiotransferase MiaB [Bacteroidales bacterium]|jgi:tRNA-2-methylthio-N6-dimethylallyladenosine synthase|nr:tRNA (N6-isopentenyl adenosine(37)-C2)-methylthiotransferase MiaB [Bacteroidales bacterium]HOL97916.1 tRNA (N6-isopentenyl adenosine(37)-C2)-methylthiotransferase MiaB [Bacteroidales bacterium]HOM35660.1 tRNA (N6-isopentenyl adenosine(37)-C2)-methylthiotransferase MiaB [Bacteroidales bacterium]HPD22779.1 tRNA (N6-isopentenyl adenosine(37)-C2)-methylthiotransferase MiaB [Bacteroidales bacterium]HRS98958.1 tRNA (N6-isopentenyl adenosine(37)-C2)-methylthiotransferase MiaB [Bacteroidales bacteri